MFFKSKFKKKEILLITYLLLKISKIYKIKFNITYYFHDTPNRSLTWSAWARIKEKNM